MEKQQEINEKLQGTLFRFFFLIYIFIIIIFIFIIYHLFIIFLFIYLFTYLFIQQLINKQNIIIKISFTPSSPSIIIIIITIIIININNNKEEKKKKNEKFAILKAHSADSINFRYFLLKVFNCEVYHFPPIFSIITSDWCISVDIADLIRSIKKMAYYNILLMVYFIRLFISFLFFIFLNVIHYLIIFYLFIYLLLKNKLLSIYNNYNNNK